MAADPLLKLGTRRSPLAMAQAEETRARLCAAHGWADSAVELVPVVASGDKVQDRALAEIGGKALWTRELDGWLHEGRIDAAVHSLKDVETLRPESLTLAAILSRADKRDVLDRRGQPRRAAARRDDRHQRAAPRGTGTARAARLQGRAVPRQRRRRGWRSWRRARPMRRSSPPRACSGSERRA